MRPILRLRRLAVRQTWCTSPRTIHQRFMAGALEPESSPEDSSSETTARFWDDSEPTDDHPEAGPSDLSKRWGRARAKQYQASLDSRSNGKDREEPSHRETSSVASSALSEVEVLQAVQNLVASGDPSILDPFGEPVSVDSPKLIQYGSSLWSLWDQLPLPTRRSMDPDTIRAVMCLVTPNAKWADTEVEVKYGSRMSQSALWEHRLRGMISAMEYAGVTTPMDYAIAMHRLSLLGNVQAVARIHAELVKRYPSILENVAVSSRVLEARLTALYNWARNLIVSHRPISVKSAWQMSIWDRNKLAGLITFGVDGKGFGLNNRKQRRKDHYRPVIPLEQAETVDAATPSALRLLWTALQDVNAQPEFFKDEVLKRIIDTLRMVRIVLKGRDAEKDIEEMVYQTLRGPFGVNMQYLCLGSALSNEKSSQPVIPLDGEMALAIVDWFGQKGDLWKMLAAAERFAKLQSVDESDIKPTVHPLSQASPIIDGTGHPYFDPSSEKLAQSPLEPLPQEPKFVLLPGEFDFWNDLWEGASDTPFRQLLTRHMAFLQTKQFKRLRKARAGRVIPDKPLSTPNDNAAEPFFAPLRVGWRRTKKGFVKRPRGRAMVRGRRTLRALHNSYSDQRVFHQFYPKHSYPLDLVRRILPFPSALSPNIHVAPLDASSYAPTDIAPQRLFSEMVRHAVARDDLWATIVACRMYFDAVTTHHNAFIREVVLKHDRAQLKETASHGLAWAEGISPPRISYNTPTILILHSFGRKQYNTKNSRPTRILEEVASNLSSALIRMKQEHFILTGRANIMGGSGMEPDEYDKAMARTKVYNPAAPFAEVFNVIPVKSPPNQRKKRAEAEPVDPRNHCYWLNVAIDRIELILDRNLAQRIAMKEKVERREVRKQEWKTFAKALRAQGRQLPPHLATRREWERLGSPSVMEQVEE